jgi:hypothetical protein
VGLQGVRTEKEVNAERIGLRHARGDFAKVDQDRADEIVARDLRYKHPLSLLWPVAVKLMRCLSSLLSLAPQCRVGDVNAQTNCCTRL